jgi:hypothetical protein
MAPIKPWFTDGFDTRDLKEAKLLLEELAARSCGERFASPRVEIAHDNLLDALK